jgi:hypothetical protein
MSKIYTEQYLEGVPLYSDLIGRSRWLRFDGVNHFINFSDTSFYNVAGKDLTLVFEIAVLRIGPGGTGSRLLYLANKGNVAIPNQNYYVVGTGGGNFQQLAFRFGNNGSTVARIFGVDYSKFTLENNLGKKLLIVYRRSNQDGTLAATLDINNYKIFVNGVKYNLTNLLTAGTITSDPFGNNNPAQIQNAQQISPLYMRKYLFYDRALSDAEVANLNVNIPTIGSKGNYPFTATYGLTLYDASSVSNNGTLYGYTTVESAIATQVIYVDDFLYIPASVVSATWTAPNKATIKRIRQNGGGAFAFTVIHKRDSSTIGSYTYDLGNASNRILNISIQVNKGDTWEISITTTSTGNYNVLEFFY